MDLERTPVRKINPASYNPRRDLQPGDPHFPQVVYHILEHLDEASGPVLARRLPHDLCDPDLLTVCKSHDLVRLVARAPPMPSSLLIFGGTFDPPHRAPLARVRVGRGRSACQRRRRG